MEEKEIDEKLNKLFNKEEMKEENLIKWFSELKLIEKQVICGLYTTIKNKGENK